LKKIQLTALLFLGLSIFFSVLSDAHEGRPVYLELSVLSSLNYELQWKIPPVMRAGQEPTISLQSDYCEVLLQSGLPQQKLVGKKRYHCSQQPNDLAVLIDYPRDNPALSSLLVVTDASGAQHNVFSDPETILIVVPDSSSLFGVAKQYAKGGIKHILAGWDHLLFVLCLLVIAGSLKRILLTVTGFTLAHTITLVLSTLGVIAVPIVFVEMLIALSIVVLAAEIINGIVRNQRSTISWKHPLYVACGFGLIHGFGFASVLSEFGLPMAMKSTALIFFNLGIELGQILFILVCLLIAKVFASLIVDKKKQDAVISSVIYVAGIMASYWLFERFSLLL